MSEHDLQLREPIVEVAKVGQGMDRRRLIGDAGAGPYLLLELGAICAGVAGDQDGAGLSVDQVRYVIR